MAVTMYDKICIHGKTSEGKNNKRRKKGEQSTKLKKEIKRRPIWSL